MPSFFSRALIGREQKLAALLGITHETTLQVFRRSGKTTQCSKLVDHLKACQVGSGMLCCRHLSDIAKPDHAGLWQVSTELWRFPDRTTALGQMINGYLASSVELDDRAVHLMFSANRWEKR